MSYGAAPRLSLHLRPTVALLLGVAAIIFGIIGMHILNVSHQASVPAAPGHSTSVSADTAHAAHHVPAADTAIPSADTANGILPAGGCNGPCAGGHHLMAAVCVLMTIVAGFVLLFVPNWLRLRSGDGLRAPPNAVGPGVPALRPPSLVQLSISRT